MIEKSSSSSDEERKSLSGEENETRRTGKFSQFESEINAKSKKNNSPK